MNLRQLEIFRAIMTTGSATSAARQIGITQPAVSHQIAQLEEDLGISLFLREKGKLVPTAKAEMIFEEVARAFISIERITDAAKDMRDGGSGILRLVAPEVILTGMLPEIMRKFIIDHPHVMFSLMVGHYDRVQEMLAMRQADVGIGRIPVDERAVEVHPLATVESVCIMPVGHKLAKKAVVTVDDLRGEKLCVLARELSSAYRNANMLALRGIRPNIRVITHSAGSSCAFIAAGLGIGITNKLIALQLADQRLIIRPFSPAAKYGYVALTPKDVPIPRLARVFIDLLRHETADLLSKAEV